MMPISFEFIKPFQTQLSNLSKCTVAELKMTTDLYKYVILIRAEACESFGVYKGVPVFPLKFGGIIILQVDVSLLLAVFSFAGGGCQQP